MKNIILITALSGFLAGQVYSQNKNECTVGEIKTSVWKPKTKHYDRARYDSTIVFIFERNFKDTLILMVGDHEIQHRFIETNESIECVPELFKFTVKGSNISPLITIHLVNNKECIQFQLKKGYRYLYVQRPQNNNWWVEFSNYQRRYY